MLKKMLCGVSLILAASAANAGVIVQAFSVGSQSTNISENISFTLFDTLGGMRTLESVTFSLDATVSGEARIENLNLGSTSVNATLSANVFIDTLANGALLTMAPTVSQMSMVNGFDGVIDFAGDSGLRFLSMSANQFDQVVLTDSASLMAYTGVGMSAFDFIANAASKVTAGGNFTSQFITVAAGSISVIYNYREDLLPSDVNEPVFLGLAGMATLLLIRLKKKGAN